MSDPRTAPRRARSFLAVVLGLVCVATSAAAPASAEPAHGRADRLPTITGTVGPGFDITIDQDSVPAGRYRLVVRDRGTIHNFHFFGDGVNRETSVPGTGRTVWRVTLTPGTYIAACVPHGSMSTSLTVT
jgi:hypothetical protein